MRTLAAITLLVFLFIVFGLGLYLFQMVMLAVMHH